MAEPDLDALLHRLGPALEAVATEAARSVLAEMPRWSMRPGTLVGEVPDSGVCEVVLDGAADEESTYVPCLGALPAKGERVMVMKVPPAGAFIVGVTNGNNAFPVGSIVDFAGQAAPSGWLDCDGSEYSNDDFPALAGALGTTYGGTAGSTFKVPDFSGVGRAHLLGTDEVLTQETRANTAYGDLATAGPSVSAYTGADVTCLLTVESLNATGFAVASVAVSGASTVAAADADGVVVNGQSSSQSHAQQAPFTGLTPGLNTFTAKYRAQSGTTGTWLRRKLSVYGNPTKYLIKGA